MDKEIVTFKTSKEYYEKEKYGLKPNTTREVDLDDDRFHILRRWETTGRFGRIRIQEANLSGLPVDNSFERDVTDVSSFKNLIIISWKHE